jgi:REP element-mobilizing transposase RayT
MDQVRRMIVREAIINVCAYRKWTLHALHVRQNHVHVVVTADRPPDRVMNDFKSYASRALNETGFDHSERRRWTRHGSTKYINDNAYLRAAIHYTLNKQGEPMERWPDTPLPDGRVS